MSAFFSKKLAALKPYTPGEQPTDKKYIKLNTNESPYPPSEMVCNAISREAVADLRLYSDPDLKALRTVIAEHYEVETENVFCSNGSDEVLSFAFLAWGSDRGVAYPDISYGFYSVFADLYGLNSKVIPLKEDFSLLTEDYNGTAGLLVFANPNAPTGLTVGIDEIERLVKANPNSVVLVDEAYVDFGGESAIDLINKYNNILVVRTFSKSRQLAGARLGYAFGCKELIKDLNTVKFSFNPYNVNRLSCLAGIAAVKDVNWFNDCVKKIINTRKRLTDELTSFGFTATDSKANFIFVTHPNLPGDMLYKRLKEKGILVRYFAKPRIDNYTRITIGTDEETDKLIEAIKSILSEI